MYHVPDKINEPLYVVVPLFNPIRYKSRYKLSERFAKYIKASGGILYIVEAAFGEREHASEDHGPADIEITKGPHDSIHITVQVRTPHELWLKENLINIGLSRLPSSWKYAAWPDADVAFARPNWVGETIHQLQHYKIVQMFSVAVDLSPAYEPIQTHRSFMDCYLKGDPIPSAAELAYGSGGSGGSGGIGSKWHPGYAWAARREALDDLGGLIDFAVLGSADKHMAASLIGQGSKSYHANVSPQYKARIAEWEKRAEHFIQRNVGQVEGLLVHYWHGKKKDRRYTDRWKILVDSQYNPCTDIKYDSQGLLRLADMGDARSIKLRDGIRRYFRQRNEDSIDL